MEDLRINIETAEEQYGSKEEIAAELEQKRTKYQEVIEFANEVEISNDVSYSLVFSFSFQYSLTLEIVWIDYIFTFWLIYMCYKT